MTYKLDQVVFESGNFWILQVDYGFEVYQIGATCSTRVARIGFKGAEGLERAKKEILRRSK